MGRLLVHMCCGPCSVYPLKQLLGHDAAKGDGAKGDAAKIDVSGFFYNPNIHPRAEFLKRLDAVKKLSALMELNVICEEQYEPTPFFAGLPGTNKKKVQKDLRCTHCYSIRLEMTARAASNHGYDFFTTSLLYSKYQNHELIVELGLDMEGRYGVPFYYEDFRVGWRDGITESKELGLYRQNYCGCVFSKAERGLFKRRSGHKGQASLKAG